MAHYVGVIHKEGKSDYGVSFPDFPGCITAGETIEKAYQMAHEALSFHIKGMREDGEIIPKPTSFEKLKKHASMKEALMTIMVEVHPESKPQRVHLLLDEWLLNRIDGITKNRSAFIAEATRYYLAHQI